jgi:hypothetical protein
LARCGVVWCGVVWRRLTRADCIGNNAGRRRVPDGVANRQHGRRGDRNGIDREHGRKRHRPRMPRCRVAARRQHRQHRRGYPVNVRGAADGAIKAQAARGRRGVDNGRRRVAPTVKRAGESFDSNAGDRRRGGGGGGGVHGANLKQHPKRIGKRAGRQHGTHRRM